MKKTDIILIIMVVVIIALAMVSSKGTKELEKINFPLELTGEVGTHEITYDQYKEMVDNGDAFIVIIERTGCGYCQQYMPIVEEYANENKVAITYINTDNLSEDDFTSLSSTNDYLKKNSWGTPTTLFMLGDRVVDAISGYVEKDGIESFLKDRIVMGE